eukprot:gene6498-10506_t
MKLNFILLSLVSFILIIQAEKTYFHDVKHTGNVFCNSSSAVGTAIELDRCGRDQGGQIYSIYSCNGDRYTLKTCMDPECKKCYHSRSGHLMCIKLPNVSYERKCGPMPRCGDEGFHLDSFGKNCNENEQVKTKYFSKATCEVGRHRISGKVYNSVLISWNKAKKIVSLRHSRRTNCEKNDQNVYNEYQLNKCYNVPKFGFVKFYKE